MPEKFTSEFNPEFNPEQSEESNENQEPLKKEEMKSEGEETVPEKPIQKHGIIDKIREIVNSKVQESFLPTQEALGYKSTVGIYGGKLNNDPEGRMVYDTRGFVSTVDRSGDAVLRTFDEHIVKDPMAMLKSHPRLFFRFLAPGTKRYRGTKEEITANAERLGLGDFYGIHDWGIEIKKPEVYKSGRVLQDIYRADLIEAEDLRSIDRFDALAGASQYVRNVHDNYGAIGEVLPSDIIFMNKNKEGKVEQPVLNLPDIIFNKEKAIGETEKKATDVMDFIMSIGVEELRRSNDWNEVKKAIQTILENYSERNVIMMVSSYIKRGRLTMQSSEDIAGLSKTSEAIVPLVGQHNKARLGLKNKDIVLQLRELISDTCDEHAKSLGANE